MLENFKAIIYKHIHVKCFSDFIFILKNNFRSFTIHKIMKSFHFNERKSILIPTHSSTPQRPSTRVATTPVQSTSYSNLDLSAINSSPVMHVSSNAHGTTLRPSSFRASTMTNFPSRTKYRPATLSIA